MTEYSSTSTEEHLQSPFQDQAPMGINPTNVFLPPMKEEDSPESLSNISGGLVGSCFDSSSTSSSQTKVNKQGCSAVYTAVYSSVSVYEMMCRGVAVMRRQKDSYLNATQVLKVANIDKGKRTKILEKEIQNKEHEKVQGGYGKYQGTWIPFARGVELAKLYRVDTILQPLLEFELPPGQEIPPSRDQLSACSTPIVKSKNRRQAEKIDKFEAPQNYISESPDHSQMYLQDMNFGGDQFFDPVNTCNRRLNLDAPPPPHYSNNFYMMDGYHQHQQNGMMHHSQATMSHSSQSPNRRPDQGSVSPMEPSSERHRATIMALFLNNGPNSQEILNPHTMLAPDFDIDLILDDQGHTALHWAAALANIPLLGMLLQKGARMDSLNFCGESAVIRSVMVAHNYDQQMFYDLITILKDIIHIPDKKNRSVLHHICHSSSIKGRVNSCIYYMQCLLNFYNKARYDEQLSSEMVHSDNHNSFTRNFSNMLNSVDICGDTAANIAARLGNRQLFDMLAQAGADCSIANYSSLKPSDYGFEAPYSKQRMSSHGSNKSSQVITTVMYPSIKSEVESASVTEMSMPSRKVNSDKSQSAMIMELQAQLSSMSREIANYRKEIKPLQRENATIPGLKSRIANLEKSLNERPKAAEMSKKPAGADEEITRLRDALSHQKAIEAHLCQELVALRTTANQHEKFCKRIISACCNVPLANVEELLQPLLSAVESDAFNLDLRLVSGFMGRIRRDDTSGGMPDLHGVDENLDHYIRPKSKEANRVKPQQLNWIKTQEEAIEPNRAFLSPAEISMSNWGQVSSRILTAGPAHYSGLQSSRQSDPTICRSCHERLKSPTMLIPCGHTFCSSCLDSPVNSCPICLQAYQHKVPNLALQELLNSSMPFAESTPVISGIPDFDQEPEEVYERYNEHLNGLQSRIEILSEENKEIEMAKAKKAEMLENAKQTMKKTLEEMKTVASQIESLRARMGELDVLARETRPLIPNLESEVRALQEREVVIKETLQSLEQRRDKLSGNFPNEMSTSKVKIDNIDDNNYVHSLPPFANAANKLLAKKIRELEAKRAAITAAMEDNKSRADAMIAHTKNVQSEANHTQALHDAKNRQIETEEHFKQLAERENGRIKIEMARIDEDLNKVSDRLNILQSNIHSGNEKIEAVKAEFKLETEELNEWLRVQKDKEEDNLALVKYTKEDDSKTKELTLAIERAMCEVSKAKANLNAEVTETQIAQLELESTTTAFRELHNERQGLITQWEESIATMQQRDHDIDAAQENYQSQKDEIRDIRAKIRERELIYQEQVALNSETDKSISITEKKIANLREQEAFTIKDTQEFKDEVEVLKNTLNKTSNDLSNKRSAVKALQNDMIERQERLRKSLGRKEEIQKKLSDLDDTSVSLEARALRLQEILKEEKQKDKQLEKEIKNLREAQFKKSQLLFKLKQEEKNLTAEIAGGEAASRNLQSKINKFDQEAAKQKQLLYTMDFALQQLERKIRRQEGERSDEEEQELNAKIAKLNAKLEAQTSKCSTLNSELKKSQDEARRSKVQLEKLEKSKNDLQTEIGNLTLYNQSVASQLSGKTREKESLMVDENIIRLELRRLRSMLHAKSDEVLSLETQKLQLKLSLEERGKEIEIQTDMLRFQIKTAEEERRSANSELRERVLKVEKLKRKYELLMSQIASDDGEGEHTQAYYVIKASQKREELQREGDELDANIKKAEKEIKALENTLKVINDRNEQYRVNLFNSEVNSNDLQHKEMLDKEYQQILKNFKERRDEIQELQSKISLLDQVLNAESSKESEVLQKVQVLEAKCDATKREIEDQSVKKERALAMARKASKQIRKKASTSNMTADEVDIFIRSSKEVGTLALKDLEKLTSSSTEIGSQLSIQMQNHGLQPPSRSVSRISSRASYRTYSSQSSGRNSVQNGAPAAEQGQYPVTLGQIRSRASATSSPSPRSADSKKLSTKNIGENVEFPMINAQQRLPVRRTPVGTTRSSSVLSNGSRKSLKE